ncbi:MAG TPA: L-seryl-tRNA(Sec) selenium transferase [Egibacteraceae bacterium]|nr:L-seryl-tRNA(Sec) selenium transferase [Egibacteraceae bacterium]
MSTHRGRLRSLPRVDALVAAADELVRRYGREATADALRAAVAAARADLQSGEESIPQTAQLIAAADQQLADRRPSPPRRVINATGVVVHTNLGRAPLGRPARDAMLDAAGYCDVEYDVSAGVRGSRHTRLEPLLIDATHAEAGIAVNNAAAALVLALAALAAGRDVLVSRGELVEIGGSFRLPEIMGASGARLVEVGTTNRTRAADFAAAGDPAAILKVHQSNYRITGFASAPSVGELAAVARERSVPLIHDAGSGLLSRGAEEWLADEPSVQESLKMGADLVLFSGDKLLGGPQAGLLVGRAELVDACRRHPLARALRLDKLRIAALTATLTEHLRGARGQIPIWSMLEADLSAVSARAQALAARTGAGVAPGVSVVGGGAAPDATVPTLLVRVDTPDPDAVAARLRRGDPPVIARIEDGAVMLDVRTVDPDDDDALTRCLREALA